MTPILVDTSAWFALYVPDDLHHTKALAWFEGNNLPHSTADYIIDELLTLLRVRRELRRAIDVACDLTENSWIQLERVSPADFHSAIQVFKTFSDKLWSFTDCTSRVVMERTGMNAAFSFDSHFHQFGTIAVVP